MKKIVCYGDSNTYGYDARSYIADRLPANERFTGILAGLGWRVAEYGENGREIPRSEAEYIQLESMLLRERPFELLMIMLGSNDAIFMPQPSAAAICERMEALLKRLAGSAPMQGARLLLVAPPRAEAPGLEWRCGLISGLGEGYARLAGRYGALFADAGAWELPLSFDGVHLSPEGHRAFAEKLAAALAAML